MSNAADLLRSLGPAEVARLRALGKTLGVLQSTSDQPQIDRAPREGPLALSFAQERLWFLDQLEGLNTAYNIPLALRLRGRLDVEAWRRSLDALYARHESLRSVFVAVDGLPQVKVLPETGVPWAEHDLRGVADAEAELVRLSTQEAQTPFDLAQGPLIRARLIRLGEEKHVFLLTQHHIVSDGWSLGVLSSEFNALYAAFASGRESPLTPLEIQYTDYAYWQRQWLTGERLAAQTDYWRQTLADAPVLLELPTDRPRPPQQDFAGAYLPIELDAEFTLGLKRLAQRHGATLFATLLAAWSAVLARLSGQDDLVIGAPTANRGQREVEGLIGVFVNTLALRLDLSGDPSMADLIAKAHAVALGAQDHQDLPFEQVVEIAQPPRRLNHAPLFQVMFAWQNNDPGKAELPGLQVGPEPMTTGKVKFDLDLSLGEREGAIVGALGYATALFDAATIERHRGYLIALLRAMIANDQQPAMGIDLLSPDERTLLLKTWNATETPYPDQLCVHQLFEQQAAANPDAVALIYEEQTLTYGELNGRANRLAHHLIALGVRPDDRIAICVERCIEMVVGLMAILKAGAAYVPLDPAYPAERLAFMLDDSQAPVLLTQTHLEDELPSHWGHTVRLDADQSRFSEQPAANPNPSTLGLTSTNLAYVIYTSGSTGTPKGVMVEHQAVVNHTLWLNTQFKFTALDQILQRTAVSFDAAVWEILSPLTSGARLKLSSHDDHRDANLIHKDLSLGVTIFQAVPLLLEALAENDSFASATELRTIFCGGDRLPGSVFQKLAEQCDATLVNLYGPTEATIDVTAWSCPDGFDGGTIPIGRPISNTRIYLLDGRLAPVPLGAVGEIFIGGAGVARGYLNRPELTAERFIASPFVQGDRLYKTGDLARYLPDGNIEFLGRNDQQVKIRGFRIELGEIEARLLEHPDVSEAVVTAREDAAGDKRLVAYYVAAGEEVGAEALRTHLGARLPDYMVPAAYVALAALPLTPNGKLDRKALPAPEGDAYARAAYEPPQGQVEAALAAIWSELLGVEQIGRHDNFFELGGHSLLAVRVLERLRRRHLSADVRTLFDHPVLSDLAARLGSHTDVVAPPNLISPDSARLTPEMLPLIELTQTDIDRIVGRTPGGLANIQDIYALSPLQEGILFHHLLATEGDPYLLVSLMAFEDRALLDRSLEAVQQVVDRHDILRTAFLWEGLTNAAQVVWRDAPLSVTEVSLDPKEGPAATQLMQRFDPRRHGIDIAEAPLLRFVVAFDAEHQRWLLLLLQHHLIGDHSTQEILRAEVEAMLEGRGESLSAPLPFRNLVAQARLGVSVEEHEAFFRSQLGDIDEPTAPFGLTDVHRDGDQVDEAQRMLPASLNARLRTQARRMGVSLASLCHLAWGQVLAKTSDRQAVVFGTVLFGRMHVGDGADRAMGLFVNTLPLRLDLDETGAEESVRLTHARLAELLRHEHASLAMAQRCSGVAVQAPLFSALLNYRHNSPPAPLASEGPAPSIEWLSSEERSNYPLALSVEDFGEALGLTAQVVQPFSPERICGYMQQALESLAEALERAPETPVQRLEVVPPDERTLLLKTWNATETPYPDQLCVHQLFEQQAAANPDAVALIYEEQTLTYGELNGRANRLAHHLIALGVRPDDRIAICVERCIEMVVGLMAILKAGAAYVPLDPAYPAERLAFMLDDSAPTLVLSHAPARPALEAALAGLSVSPPVLDLDAKPVPWARRSKINPNPSTLGLTSTNLAYVIYTSGSTGTPKGVMVEHRNIASLTKNNNFCDISPSDVFLNSSPATFDATTFELWGALANGACLVLYAATQIDIADLEHTLNKNHVTVAWMTARLFDSFEHITSVRQPWQFRACPMLKFLIVGGEVVLPGSLHKFYLRHPHLQILNGYGPTETTTFSATFPAPRNIALSHSIPIGRPISNTRIYLLDGRLAPVPLGAVGEIFIGGAGVARGYLNRPELTAERFIASPFVQGDRLYKTGDLARYLPDGNIEFLGRNDQQVKIRGFRIELGEIEARLLEHPDVSEAVVTAREDAAGDKRLVAYYVAAGEEVGAEALRTHLGARLPDYMVPAAYVALAALPLTPNGKLDRKALPAPEGDAYARAAYEPPQGQVEAALAAIWSELLGVEQIGRHDNFFELGGHSLLAVRMINRATDYGLQVRPEHVFQTPILRDVANHLASSESRPSATAIPVRRAGSQNAVFFVPTGLGRWDYLFSLAKVLNIDCPLYALPWQSPREARHLTMEALALRMVATIQAVQPHGPYRLAGYSSGGILAYAIAQQLLGLDEDVSFLGFIDVSLPSESPTETGSARQILIDWLKQVELAKRRPKRTQVDYEGLSLDSLIKEAHRLRTLQWMEAQHWEQVHEFALAIGQYAAPSLPLTIYQFHATELRTEDPTLGWGRVLAESDINLVAIPGDHASIMTDPENRAQLGKRLGEALTVQEKPRRHPPFSPLIALNNSDAGTAPLLCIPGAGASVTAFMELSNALNNRRSTYGLEPRGMDNVGQPHASVEAMAEFNLQAIEHLSSAGPIHLMGHSFGGLIAFQMAIRLRNQGRNVASLTLIDSSPPRSHNEIKDLINEEIFRDFTKALEAHFNVTLNIDKATLPGGKIDRFINSLHQTLLNKRLVTNRTNPNMLRGPLAVFSAACRASYAPTCLYNAKAHLIMSSDPLLVEPTQHAIEQKLTLAEWHKHIDKISVWLGPGNHFSMLRSPHVQILANYWETITN